MPLGSVCCDAGNETTSSYCTNGAGGGCYRNPNPSGQHCSDANPLGPSSAAFCCSSNGGFGSHDCPEGQHHCGNNCQPSTQPCCAEGASLDECPTASYMCQAGSVSCGVCRTQGGNCQVCPAGFCCQGDPCGAVKCLAGGGVCSGASGGSDAGSGSCPGGLLASERSCQGSALSGTCTCNGFPNSICITPADFAAATGGLQLPSQCTAQGGRPCMDSQLRLAFPCCPGLACVVGQQCGADPTAGLGQCLPH